MAHLNSTFYDLTCEICGCRMIEQKCKIRCPNCGFTRDCSDPYRVFPKFPPPLGEG